LSTGGSKRRCHPEKKEGEGRDRRKRQKRHRELETGLEERGNGKESASEKNRFPGGEGERSLLSHPADEGGEDSFRKGVSILRRKKACGLLRVLLEREAPVLWEEKKHNNNYYIKNEKPDKVEEGTHESHSVHGRRENDKGGKGSPCTLQKPPQNLPARDSEPSLR